jgi:hypothetical protein
METHHSNTCLSIYGIEDVPAFVIKEGAPAFIMRDRMRDVTAFVIKGDMP